jgi:hypothetical protein
MMALWVELCLCRKLLAGGANPWHDGYLSRRRAFDFIYRYLLRVGGRGWQGKIPGMIERKAHS